MKNASLNEHDTVNSNYGTHIEQFLRAVEHPVFLYLINLVSKYGVTQHFLTETCSLRSHPSLTPDLLGI